MLSEAVKISNNATHRATHHTPMHMLSPPSPPPSLPTKLWNRGGKRESRSGKGEFCFMLCCSLIPFDYLVDAVFPLAPSAFALLDGWMMMQLKPDPWWEHPLGLGDGVWRREKSWANEKKREIKVARKKYKMNEKKNESGLWERKRMG